MGDDELQEWRNLPYHVWVNVCSYLNVYDRNRFARVCKDFSQIFRNKGLWRKFRFCLSTVEDIRFLECLHQYGQYFQYLEIELDQWLSENRDSACWILSVLAQMRDLQLRSLVLRYKGENPMFYSGAEFKEKLINLLGPTDDGRPKTIRNTLVNLDLGETLISLNDTFVDVISSSCPNLEKLNIQNSRVLLCQYTHHSVSKLVDQCRNLRELHVHYQCITDGVLMQLTEANRVPLHQLSMLYQGGSTIGVVHSISPLTWQAVIDKLPQFRVSLIFDETCAADLVIERLQPEIPVKHLIMETSIYMFDEVNSATLHYAPTLRYFVLHTPISNDLPRLNRNLVTLAAACESLEEICVYCVIDIETVETILRLHPIMQQRGTHVLRHEPWIIPSNPAAITGHSDVF